jgi:hypothetical protein
MAVMTTPELSNVDIVVYTLFKLGGYGRKIHTEEVAYEAYRLAKERFGWRLKKFREMGFPDKEPVRSGLTDAAKEKYGHLVEGRAGVEAKGKETDGWILTSQGVAWIREHEKRIESALGATRPSTRTVDARRFKRQMRDQPLYQRFVDVGSLDGENRYAFTDMLEISPDAPKEVITMKFRTLRSTAQLVADQQIINFLNACTKAFINLLPEINSVPNDRQ